VTDARRFRAEAKMPLAGNTNHLGTMYAGSLFSLGEVCGGLIYLVSFDYDQLAPLVKEVRIRFVKPARTDVHVAVGLTPEQAADIEQRALDQGKADFEMTLDLTDDHGDTVAVVSGLWQVRRKEA
jgi:acyl-coenzyme A thioesterase PaaI-like protein